MKVALGDRGMTVEAAQHWAKVNKERRALVHMLMIEFNAAIFAYSCILRPPTRALVDFHLERGGIQLHDSAEVNCIKMAQNY